MKMNSLLEELSLETWKVGSVSQLEYKDENSASENKDSLVS